MTDPKRTADRTSTMQEWADATHYWGGANEQTHYRITSRMPCPTCGYTGGVTGEAPGSKRGKVLISGRYIPCACGTPRERGVSFT